MSDTGGTIIYRSIDDTVNENYLQKIIFFTKNILTKKINIYIIIITIEKIDKGGNNEKIILFLRFWLSYI